MGDEKLTRHVNKLDKEKEEMVCKATPIIRALVKSKVEVDINKP